MSGHTSLSRRTALAGLGASSLGFFASRLEAATSSAASATTSLAGHPLTGFWLTLMALPSHPDDVLAVPAIFGADGSAVLIFPCTEANESGVQVKGAAIGTWAPIDDRYAHFTTVQALSGMDGQYHGTVTFDAYPWVNDDGDTFDVQSQYDLFTVRDQMNHITASTAGPFRNPMRAYRMHPGHAGFPMSLATSDADEDLRDILEVAPVDPSDPRLHRTGTAPADPGMGKPQ
jgi:hypothetical protein